MTLARRLAIGALGALLLLSACTQERDQPKQRASIVMVMLDTLRADYVGTYGFSGDVSPHIDAIGREGVVFERAFAQSPWTKPSIASLFTGLYPEVHKVLTENGRYRDRRGGKLETDALPGEAVTLAEALRQEGYATAAFVANPWIRAAHGFAQGFATFDTEGADNEMPAAEIVRRARAWLAQQPEGEPFFLYVHLMDVHGPYTAPDEHYDALAGSSATIDAPGRLPEPLYKRIPPYLRQPAWAQRDDAREVSTWRQRYAAGVRWVDAQLVPLWTDLRDRQVYDSSWIVVTSDHGEALYDNQLWDHGYSLYEHQIRVPMIVRFPGGAHGGRRVGAVAELVDLMPTLLAGIGAPVPDGIQGEDLTPTLQGHVPEVDVAFAEAVKWRPTQRGVRVPGFKLIFDPGADRQVLYDLTADPGETRDASAQHPQVVARLLELLQRYEARKAAHDGFAGEAAEVPPDVAERLRSLGYFQ